MVTGSIDQAKQLVKFLPRAGIQNFKDQKVHVCTRAIGPEANESESVCHVGQNHNVNENGPGQLRIAFGFKF
jgi:hypothetical protein